MSNLRTMAQLAKMELHDAFIRKSSSRPLRVGYPHASAVLSDESEWCVRRHVLGVLYPDQAERPERDTNPAPWEMKSAFINEHGWTIHEKYQQLVKAYGGALEVVYTDGEPELDRTHFDSERLIYFSPDMILNFMRKAAVWEIKGYKNTDDPSYRYEAFEKCDEGGEIPQKAYKQCNFYCHLLGIKYGFVLVEGKNSQDTKVWAFEHNPADAWPYTQRCYDFKGSLTIAKNTLAGEGKPKLPARKCATCTDRLAAKCPMRKVCFDIGE